MNRLRDDFWLIPLALAGLLIRAYGIADPWLRGHRGFNGALSGLLARNYIRYGLETCLAPIWASGPLTRSQMVECYHLRHPSLRHLSTALFTAILGLHEWVITLLPVLFSVGSAVVLYFFVKRISGKWTALLALGFITVVPMDAYYGGMSGYEPEGMFFALLALLLYARWFEKHSTRIPAGVVVCLGIAGFVDYPGFYMTGLIGLHYLCFGPRNRRTLTYAFGLWAYAVALFGAWVLYVGCLSGSVLTLVKGASLRLGAGSEARFTWADYYTLEYERIRLFFTPVLRLLSVAWAVFVVLDLRRRKRWLAHSWIVLLFLYGMANLLLFPQGAWVHEYWLFFLSPFVTVASAVAVRELSIRVFGKRTVWTVILVLLIWAWYLPAALAGLQAQHAPRDDAEASLARWINACTGLDDSVLFGFEVLQPQVDYYLDRRRDEFADPAEFEHMIETGLYTRCVLRSPRSLDQEFVQQLIRTYPAETYQDYVIFDLTGGGASIVGPLVEPAHEVDRTLVPGVELLGYSGPDHIRLPVDDGRNWLWHYLHSTSYEPDPVGRQVTYTLFWRAGDGIEADLRPRLRLVGDDGAKRYLVDTLYSPVTDLYSTGLWQAGERIAATYTLEFDEDYPPGIYRLEVTAGEALRLLADVTVEWGDTLPVLDVCTARMQTLNEPVGEQLTLSGYRLDREVFTAGQTIHLATCWQGGALSVSRGVSACLQDGSYEMCRALGVVGGPDWQAQGFRELDVALPLHPAMLDGEYDLVLALGPEPWDRIPLDAVEIEARDQHWPLLRVGFADWEGDAVLSPGDSLTADFVLDQPGPVRLLVDWTGRAELSHTRIDAYVSRDGGSDVYLGTREVCAGGHSLSEWTVGETLAGHGDYRIKLSVSPERGGLRRPGWRGVLDRWFPDLLNESSGPWSGDIQIDLLRLERDSAEVWGNYRDLMRRYIERGMWAEASGVYEQAVAQGVRPDAAGDLDLLSFLARETGSAWMPEQLGAEATRLIPNRTEIDFGGTIRLEGYSFTRRGREVQGRFYVRVLKSPEHDWTLWVHGVPDEPGMLSGADREAGFANMDTLLPSSGWEAGRLYEVTSSKELPAARFEIHLGLWRWEDGTRLWRDDRPDEHEVNLGWLDL